MQSMERIDRLADGTDGLCGMLREANACCVKHRRNSYLALGRVPAHGHVRQRLLRIRVRLS
jgi:hypothetical protein